MGNSNVKKQQLDTAGKTGCLGLKNVNLKEIPADILRLRQNLRKIDLSDNKLEVIPGFIGEFTAIKHLTVDNNRLGYIPDEIGQLEKLEQLSLAANRLQSPLTDFLGTLVNLKSLNLSENQLTQFPLAIVALKKLSMVDLSQNKIEVLPDGVGELAAVELNLNNNNISEISPDIANCPKLKVLRLKENCLALDAFSEQILADSAISLFVIDGNLFDEKQFRTLAGHEAYMERFTATKKKMY